MTTPTFKTDRSSAGYNLSIRRDANGKMHIAIDAGAAGMAIMLTDEEERAFIDAIAALAAPDGIPPHEPSSCGTAYLASERALRIIEHATQLGEAMSADAIEQITNLAHEAGAACNRRALSNAFADDLPF